MERALRASERLHTPHLVDLEIVHTLRRLVQRKEITILRAEQAIDDLGQLVIARHGHEALRLRIWQLRDSHTAYDGAYIALAEALDAPLVTCDARLARAHGHQAAIELIEI